jgi:hypothetical protein
VTILRGAAWQAEVVEAGDRLAVPLATARRIAFCSLEPHAGVSRLAVLTARTLARARRGRLLVADLTPDGAENLLPPATAATDDGLPRAVVDATAAHGVIRGIRAEGGAGDPTAGWDAQVAPIVRYFDVVVADWGVRPVDGGLLDIAGTAHAVCIVSAADRASSEATIAAARALRDALPGTEAVVALVDRARTGSPWPAIAARIAPVPVLPLPFDAELARTGRASLATRRAALTLAGLLMPRATTTGVRR